MAKYTQLSYQLYTSAWKESKVQSKSRFSLLLCFTKDNPTQSLQWKCSYIHARNNTKSKAYNYYATILTDCEFNGIQARSLQGLTPCRSPFNAPAKIKEREKQGCVKNSHCAVNFSCISYSSSVWIILSVVVEWKMHCKAV